jgi:hypothetical protein
VVMGLAARQPTMRRGRIRTRWRPCRIRSRHGESSRPRAGRRRGGEAAVDQNPTTRHRPHDCIDGATTDGPTDGSDGYRSTTRRDQKQGTCLPRRVPRPCPRAPSAGVRRGDSCGVPPARRCAATALRRGDPGARALRRRRTPAGQRTTTTLARARHRRLPGLSSPGCRILRVAVTPRR